ncbi:hypothetical protein RND81_13G010600 [Saponaria officinalis]|uniref:Uncharacterized protein n=1 Tax=Saponaria officinalis TaxID=3572 RepID=A0AAW1GVJ7_SAPOF
MAKNGEKVDEIVGSTGRINLTNLNKEDLSNQVHHLPCCVKFTGPTHVSHYFKPKYSGIEVDGLQVEEAFFRGRNLQGVSVPLPQGYSGFILENKNSSKDNAKKSAGKCNATKISDVGENSWETLAKCHNMTFWNHDSPPSQDDASLRLFHLFAVAKALHEPLSTEDLNSATVAKIQNS